MQFYRLTYPDYKTDQEFNLNNPIRMIRDIWLPGIICSKCGSTWAGNRRLYLSINDESLRGQLRGGPVPQSEWENLSHQVRVTVGLPDDYLLKPGDVLGKPIAELQHSKLPDFLHPFPGQLIVKSNVIETLQRAKLTGFHPIPVEVSWSKKVKKPPELPNLYELMVTGSARRVDITEEITCQACGRRKFPRPEWLVVDEGQWDRSDFLYLDGNPNIVIVTDRVCSVLAEQQFTNYACISVS